MLGRLMQELCESCNVDRSTTARKPLLDLLQQPAIAVEIAEGDKRAVAATFGIRTADSNATKQVGLWSVPAYTPPPSWNTWLASTPCATSSSRAACMSETMR